MRLAAWLMAGALAFAFGQHVGARVATELAVPLNQHH